ncbi:MAG TPA: 7TM diverse intracellular signaling domain-containing protein [Bacteroidia bacterium]|jgi:signal transduction histidine kinase|nr:7TM diverse intracellular signaling domain-containing protein [Bacteroidia bacterium]HMU19984.1 7TM diverse intracellular signaling domain-containing protein [Bacteroidia bacterium]
MDFRFLTDESKLYGITFFIAIVLFQMVFMFVQWLINKRADYLYYIAYMISINIYGLILYEHLFHPSPFALIHPNLLSELKYSLPLFSVILYYRFQQSFLDLKFHRPKLNMWVNRLELFLLIYCIISPILIFFGIDKSISFHLFVLIAIITIAASILIIISFLQKSIPLERYSMAGALLIVIGSLAAILIGYRADRGMEILYCNPHLPLLVCVIAELLTFTTGLTYKARMIERAKSETETKLMNKIREKQNLEIDFLQMRNSVSRELHDSLGAELSTARMMLNSIHKNDKEGDQKLLGNSISMLSGSISTLYRLMDEMNNFSVAGSDCISDIQKIINLLQPINSVQFGFIHFMEEGKLPGGYNYHIVQITRELINNTLKYADATQVDIDIQCANNLFEYTYSDNGKGFDINNCSKGNGLNNIAGRVSECSGTIKIDTSAGKGIMVNITIGLAES